MSLTGYMIQHQRDYNPRSPQYYTSKIVKVYDIKDCPITFYGSLYYLVTNGYSYTISYSKSYLDEKELLSYSQGAIYITSTLSEIIDYDGVVQKVSFLRGTDLLKASFPNAYYAYCGSASHLTYLSLPNAISIAGFSYCSSIKTLYIPNIEYAYGGAFYSLGGELTLSKAKYIGLSAFYGTTLTLPSDVLISDNSTYPCKTDGTLSSYNFLSQHTYDNYVNMKGSYLGIATCVVEHSLLETIELSKAFIVEESTFYNCSNLTYVSLPNVEIFNGSGVFKECTWLTSIELPKVREIGFDTFEKCYRLSYVSIPKAEIIHGAAFSNCSNLSTIYCPNVISIGGGVFYNCSLLISISLPKITYIARAAFSNCDYLKSIYVPSSMISKLDSWYSSLYVGI